MNRFGDIDASFKRLPPVYGYHAEKLVSLEEALQAIKAHINGLPHFIKIAKQYCHFPSEHGLSHDQSAAVYIYTMEWGETTLYRVLNKALRSENRQALKIWFPYLKLFDTALDLLPTVKEGVWRGIPLDICKNFTKNQTLTWWSFNSCSSSVNVIKNFLGGENNATLFLIETFNGKKISGYTEYENEDEIILRMGNRFRVKSDILKQSNGSYLVHLIELGDNNDQPLASDINQLKLTAAPFNTSTLEKQKISRSVRTLEKCLRDATAIADESRKQSDAYKEQAEKASVRVRNMKRREEKVTQMTHRLRKALREKDEIEDNPTYQRARPSTAHSSSTSYVRTLVTSTKYYSELSDDDLQSEATNASVSETPNGGN
ncbi:unnamed protein product [Rotaria sp. Silwood1]|nr:unnamed protein product [Rotaria sp. Silwood1]